MSVANLLIPNQYVVYCGNLVSSIVIQQDLPWIEAERTTTQSIPNNTITNVAFPTVIARNGGFPLPTVGSTVFTPPFPGWYQVNYQVLFPLFIGATGLRLSYITVDGSPFGLGGVNEQLADPGTTNVYLHGTANLFFDGSTNSFTITVHQAQGSAVSIESCSLSCTYLHA